MSHKEFHNISQDAVNEIITKAKEYDLDFRGFHERQLAHEISCKSINCFSIFEMNVNEGKRCDLVVHNKNKDQMEFIEVKSTGLTPDGRWENRFGNFPWENDFEKLSEIDENIYNASSVKKYWVWQFVFETYKREVENIICEFNILEDNDFNGPYKPEEIIPLLNTRKGKNKTLGKVLNEISENYSDVLISIIPRIKEYNEEFSLLLLTTEL